MERLTRQSSEGLVLDPRTKLLLLLMVNILMYSFGASLYIYLSVALAAVLMLLAGNYRYLLYIGGFYAILFTIDYAMGFAPENLLLLWNTLSIPFFIFLPFIMYAMLFFTTTTINDAAAAFQKMRMPSFVLIPLLVMFRFIPTIYQEFRAITNAMKLRGVAGGGNPVRAVEYVYVPLLFSLVKIGEELTLASLTRGLGLHKDRTYVNEPVMRWYDYAALVVMLLLVLGSRWGPTL